MKLLYFAWVRQRTGVAEETVSLPASVEDVAGLIDWLKGRGPGYAEALADGACLRVAVNQSFAGLDSPVGPDDEVAVFPPMTGG